MTPLKFDLVSGSPDERLDEFERFVEHWLSTRQDGYGVSADVLETLTLPKPLRRFYAFLGNWPGSPMCVQNILRPPETLADQKGAAIGLIEFAVENQGVYRWATVAEGDDPPVYFADHWDDLPADAPLGDYPAPGWYEWDGSLTNFLIGYAMTELALAPSPSVVIPWSSALELYAQGAEAQVVQLQASAAGDPQSILVDGEYLLDGREHDRWRFCAARSSESAAALKRFDGELDRLYFDYGKLKPKKPHSRSWSIEVWATGAARVRHHTLDEWLPPKTVDVEALMAILDNGAQASGPRVWATVKKLGEGDTKASIAMPGAVSLFDSIIEAIPPKNRGLADSFKSYHARAYAEKYPPAVLGREPADVPMSPKFISQPAMSASSTVPESGVLALLAPTPKTAKQSDASDAIVVQLDDWMLSIRTDGSGAISWKQFKALFGAGSINVAQCAAQLRSGNIVVEPAPIRVDFLIETLKSHLELKPDLSFRENLEFLEEFGERAVQRKFKAAVRIFDATPSTHAVDPLVVETIWKQVLDVIDKLPVSLQTAAKATPPDFAKAAEFVQSFRVNHPDILAADDAAKP